MIARAVIFDMDGLLVDSERAMLECWRDTAVQQSLALDDTVWFSMVGLHELGCAESAQRLIVECKYQYDQLVERGLPLKPGVRELLEYLAGHDVPMAVATSTQRERARLKLARSGIDGYFSHVVTSSDVVHAKPAPDLYLLAAQRLGIAPDECIALEDSEFGVRAASAAGIKVIQVPDMVPATDLTRQLAHVIPSLPQARPLIDAFLGFGQMQDAEVVLAD